MENVSIIYYHVQRNKISFTYLNLLPIYKSSQLNLYEHLFHLLFLLYCLVVSKLYDHKHSFPHTLHLCNV